MTPDRWRQINDLFHAALERRGEDRRQLLDEAAATDAGLAAEVQSLLATHEATGDFLDRPVWEVEPELIVNEPGGLLAGTRAGPYEILREISRGGMGVVYEAEDTRLGRRVALKVLPPEYASDPVRRERLAREARAAAALTHPAIATIYSLDDIDGTLFLSSELVRGETLREELRHGAIRPDRLLPTLLQLASGLAAAHAHGIVHRDFKPENIMRAGDGGVKILDFGVAHMSGPDPVTQIRLTQTGMAIGTPGYMAPEQLEGKTVDARTDVFAFGVVGWELATGINLFGSTAAELVARVTDLLDGRPGTIADAVVPVPGLEPILRRCLRRHPAERYESARELLGALERLAAPGGQADGTALRRSPSAPDRRAVWWWQFHQGVMSAVIASLPVVAWFIRGWDTRIGTRIFLIVLALSTISVTIRLNLLFTSRVHHSRLAVQRARVYTAMAAVEAVLGVLLLIAALLVSESHNVLAAVLVTLSVATVASLGIIEPATTAAALGAGQDER